MEHKHTMVEEEEEEEENHHSYLYAESEVEILYNCKWYPAIILRAKQLTEQDQDEGERCCYEIEIDYRLLMDKEKWFLHRKAGGSKRKWMDPLPLYLMDKISCKNILYEYCSHMIRPRPQPSSVRWERGDEVEAFFGTFWLCGEVTQLLNDSKYIVTFYSHFSEEFEESELRMVQNWTGREWERIRARDIDSKCVQFRCFDRPSYIEFEEKFRRAGRFLQGYYIGDDEEIHYSETSSSSNGLILTMNTAQEGSGSLPTELLPQSQIELCHLLYNDDDDDDDDYYYDFIGYHAIIKKSKQIYEHYEIECELLIDINKWMLHSNVGSLKRLDYDPLPLFLSHIKGLRIEVDYYWEPLNEQHVQDWKEGERVEAFFGSFWKNGQIIGVLKDSRYLVKFKKLGVDVFGQRDLRPLGNSQYPQYRILSGDIWEQEIKRARKLLESLYIDDESSVKTSTSDTATTTMQAEMPNAEIHASSISKNKKRTRDREDISWKHCTEVQDESTGKSVRVCNYCGRRYNGGGIQRIKEHLAHEGKDAQKCPEVPPGVKDLIRRDLKANALKKQQQQLIASKHIQIPNSCDNSTKNRKKAGKSKVKLQCMPTHSVFGNRNESQFGGDSSHMAMMMDMEIPSTNTTTLEVETHPEPERRSTNGIVERVTNIEVQRQQLQDLESKIQELHQSIRQLIECKSSEMLEGLIECERIMHQEFTSLSLQIEKSSTISKEN